MVGKRRVETFLESRRFLDNSGNRFFIYKKEKAQKQKVPGLKWHLGSSQISHFAGKYGEHFLMNRQYHLVDHSLVCLGVFGSERESACGNELCSIFCHHYANMGCLGDVHGNSPSVFAIFYIKDTTKHKKVKRALIYC